MSKLLVVIIDGLSTETLACAHVSSLERLGKRGVIAGHSQSQHLHLTLPNLVSVFTSLPPEEHGVHCESGAANPSPGRFPCFPCSAIVIKISLLSIPATGCASSFPKGALQTGVLINSQSIRNVDREITEQAARHLQREKPDCCLLYLEGAKITGTHFGFTSEPYLESVEQADHALGMIMEHLLFVGAEREYATLVVGFGGAASQPETGHRCAPLVMAGPGIARGVVVEQPVALLDLAPTMASILGLAPHPDWRGRMLAEWFQQKALEMRPVPTTKKTSDRKREQLAA